MRYRSIRTVRKSPIRPFTGIVVLGLICYQFVSNVCIKSARTHPCASAQIRHCRGSQIERRRRDPPSLHRTQPAAASFLPKSSKTEVAMRTTLYNLPAKLIRHKWLAWQAMAMTMLLFITCSSPVSFPCLGMQDHFVRVRQYILLQQRDHFLCNGHRWHRI